MTNMLTMSRPVSDKHKVQGNSLPEIVRAWKQSSLDLDDDPEITEAARGALRPGNLLVAFLLDALSQDDAERRQRAIRGLKILERLKERDEPLDLRRMNREDFRRLGDDDRGDERAGADAGRPKGATMPRAPHAKGSKKIG